MLSQIHTGLACLHESFIAQSEEKEKVKHNVEPLELEDPRYRSPPFFSIMCSKAENTFSLDGTQKH